MVLIPKLCRPSYVRLYSSVCIASTCLSRAVNYFPSIQAPHPQSLLKFHAHVITSGQTNNVFISSKLISLYASLKNPSMSTKVFDSVGYKDTFLWNSNIKAHFSCGKYSEAFDIYLCMRSSDTLPNQFTIPMIVATCAELGALNYGMVIHGLVYRLGLFACNSAVGSSFVYMYSKCGLMDNAAHVFDNILVKDVISWTALIIGYVQNDESDRGLMSFCEMHKKCEDGARPNFRTFEGCFQACGNIGAALEGRCFHGLAVKSGVLGSQIIQCSILSMYSKCGTLKEAYESFFEVPLQDLMTWTSIIGVYAKLGCNTKCVDLLMDMLDAGIYPDGMVTSCVLSGLSNSMKPFEGKAFHGFVIRRNYEVDQIVQSALLSMYCKFGLLGTMENIFNAFDGCDKESWNLMVYGYGKASREVKCLEFFTEMQHLGIESDPQSLVSVISSCARLGLLHLGQSLHCYSIKRLFESVSVSNSLIDMYGKLGNLPMARKIFCMAERDTITWNTMMSAYFRGGHPTDAFALFERMLSEGIKASSTTLVIVLSACSHIASLEKGEQVHNYIEEEMIMLNLPLATALIDMYSKCGQLEKARAIFDVIKEKDIICWNVMISSYGLHGDAETAIGLFQEMEKSTVRPNEITFLSVLSACTHAGLVEEGKYLFKKMGDYVLNPTLKHYACIVDLLGRSGNLLEAEKLILSMPIAPDGGIWGALLSACEVHNAPEIAIRIAKRAIESDPQNDGYYVTVSNLYNSIGLREEAEKLRNGMKEKGVRKTAGWSAV